MRENLSGGPFKTPCIALLIAARAINNRRRTEAQVDDRSAIPILRKPTKELKEAQETTLPGEGNKSHRTDSNR